MVRIATLDSVKIYMYADEHPPPHFHAVTAEFVAQIAIEPPRVIRGRLPPAVTRRVIEWTGTHQTKLVQAWDSVQSKRKPRPIK